MKLGICSFAFHRTFGSGEMDLAGYARACKELGCTQLDPWNAHLSAVGGDKALFAGRNPDKAELGVGDEAAIEALAAISEDVGLPFGLIAVDGAHIMEDSEIKRAENRRNAYAWLQAAQKLGATQIRVDAGGPADMPDDAFALIVEGYKDIVARGQDAGVEILIENHWGPSIYAGNVIRILEAVPGLGLLLDTNNWTPTEQGLGWKLGAPYARATHLKCMTWDDAGENEISNNIPMFVELMKDVGFDGAWGVESYPMEPAITEYEACRRTIALLHRELGA